MMSHKLLYSTVNQEQNILEAQFGTDRVYVAQREMVDVQFAGDVQTGVNQDGRLRGELGSVDYIG